MNKYIKKAYEIVNKGDISSLFKPLMMEYRKAYVGFARGEYTQDFYNKKRQDFIMKMRELQLNLLNGMIEELVKVKEEHLTVEPKQETKDLVELSLVEKELEVMTDDELVDFYRSNVGDANLMRLFNITLKKNDIKKKGSMDLVQIKIDQIEDADETVRFIDDFIRQLETIKISVEKVRFVVHALSADSAEDIDNNNGLGVINIETDGLQRTIYMINDSIDPNELV